MFCEYFGEIYWAIEAIEKSGRSVPLCTWHMDFECFVDVCGRILFELDLG